MIRPSVNRPVPLFVYGSLRSGGRLHTWYLQGIKGHRAYAHGYGLRVIDRTAPFPFMVKARGETTVGEVYWITDPQTLAHAQRMEENAGYVTRYIDVEFADNVLTVPALAFVWPHGGAMLLVPDNDWIEYTQEVSVHG